MTVKDWIQIALDAATFVVLALTAVVRAVADFHRFTRRSSKTHVLSHGDVKTWHRTIFQGVVPLPYYAGFFRGSDLQRPCLAVDVHVNGRQGEPFPTVNEAMRDWSSRIVGLTDRVDQVSAGQGLNAHSVREILRLVAFVAGRFVQIHPFINGNGRMSRLSANYFLARYDLPYLFETPQSRPRQPYADVSSEAMTGNFGPMYDYLLEALTARRSA